MTRRKRNILVLVLTGVLAAVAFLIALRRCTRFDMGSVLHRRNRDWRFVALLVAGVAGYIVTVGIVPTMNLLDPPDTTA